MLKRLRHWFSGEEEAVVMNIVVGLGNPGALYARNRHNVGFQCLDFLADRHGLRFDGNGKFKADVTRGRIADTDVLLLKPQTMMNLSGFSVLPATQFYKVPTTNLLVVCDDMDLPVGRLRLRPSGSSGGQNGLKHIVEQMGTQFVPRLRVGIGRPQRGDPKDYVLNDFDREQAPMIVEIYPRVAAAIETWLREGMTTAMNRFNQG